MDEIMTKIIIASFPFPPKRCNHFVNEFYKLDLKITFLLTVLPVSMMSAWMTFPDDTGGLLSMSFPFIGFIVLSHTMRLNMRPKLGIKH